MSTGIGTLARYGAFDKQPTDGIEALPDRAGVYFILNRSNGLRYVGSASRSIRRRAMLHRSELRRGVPSNMLLRRDVLVYGPGAFCFIALCEVTRVTAPTWKYDLAQLELDWAIRLWSHDERFGYNMEAGFIRTAGALFREHERRQLGEFGTYQMLPNKDRYASINPELLESWVRGRASSR